MARNGYALLTDLREPTYVEIVRAMEGYQAAFLARTRRLWDAEFPITGDALGHFSRQWEYPYAWANLGDVRGRVLDAGSGITFFPFLLATAGFEVTCCDADETLGLPVRYEAASALTGCAIEFTGASLLELPFDPETFDAVACISVLEHAGANAPAMLEAFAAVLRPDGRLVLTLDVDLRKDGDLVLEDVAALLEALKRSFDLVHPLDLSRPPELLTSESFLAASMWRLPPPWRPNPRAVRTQEFRSIAVLGLTATKRAQVSAG